MPSHCLPLARGRYKSFAKARVVRDKWSRKSRGYGFVSFLDAFDAATAMREMQGTVWHVLFRTRGCGGRSDA